MANRRLTIGALAALAALFLSASAASAAGPSIIYDSIPSPLPPNVVSQGYECCTVFELGDNIAFAGTARSLKSVTITMSTWTRHSEWPAMPAEGWTHPITLNFYNVDHSAAVPAVGSPFASLTQTFLIPWKPEGPTCATTYGPNFGWVASDSKCYNGFAFNITFDFSSLNVTVPDGIIYGIAYNTSEYGYAPLRGTNPGGGPYDSLNVGFRDTSLTAYGPVPVGTDVEPNAAFQYASGGFEYCDGGASGTNVFRRDDGCWIPYSLSIRFEARIGPPTNKGQCKDGGWMTFNNPSFKNQGECVSYTNHH